MPTSDTSLPSAIVPRWRPSIPIHSRSTGDTRVDNYYWLRDDERQKPEVLDYLKAENAYTEAMLAGQAAA